MGRKHRNQRKRLRKDKKQRKSRTKIEEKIAHLLDDMGIHYKQNARIGRYNVDFLIDDKYVVECYGDYWHCNPTRYGADYYSRGLKCEAHERWKKDKTRKGEIQSRGYEVLELWESEIYDSRKYCRLRIRQLLEGA
jgi:very-short-patch-repair endonuclease